MCLSLEIAILLILGLCQAFPFPAECGITYIEPENVENTTRILGGFEAVPGSWPWQAYLKFQGEFYCGGTLIHPEWVLSAGHCFAGFENPEDWQIVMGEHDDEIEEGWEQPIDVATVIVHPKYNAEDIDFDFTLIKLAHPVELNDHVAPACFPEVEADMEMTFPPGKVCITSGWGTINAEGTVRGPVLKQEYAELWSNSECNEAYDSMGYVTDRMVCAGKSP